MPSARVPAILTVVLLLASLALSFRPAAALVHRPIVEDGYYVLSVSRNLATGHGVTIDGEHLTNGFQPLFVFANVPAYVLGGGDRFASLRYVLIYHWLVFLAAGFLFALIVRDLVRIDLRHAAFWIAGFAHTSAVYLFWQHFNGLETGTTLFMYLAVARAYQTKWGGGANELVVGILLGLLVLARIDAVFFVIVFSAIVAETARRNGATPRAAIRTFITLSGAALVVSSPWWIYNQTAFGSILPSGGKAQQRWAFEPTRFFEALHALAIDSAPHIFLAGYATWAKTALYLAAGTVAIIAAVFAWKRVRQGIGIHTAAEERVIRFRTFLTALLIATLVLASWYVASSFAAHFYRRYFACGGLIGLLAATMVMIAVYQKSRLVGGIVCGLISLPVLATIALMLSGRRAGESEYYRDQVGLIADLVPPGENVGAFQSGTLGYFRDHVINLDGKVNADAIRRKNDMPNYVDDLKLNWLCDWQEWAVKGIGTDFAARDWHEIARRGNFILYQRTPPKM